MAFTVENGTGIRSANAYITVTEFKSYHSDRGNTLSGGSTDQQRALIQATDYIDKRFGHRFKGIRKYTELRKARATLTASANPAELDTVVIGTRTYRFTATLTNPDDVLLSANASDTLDNLLAAILLVPEDAGVRYQASTTENTEVSAESLTGDRLLIVALREGTPGNLIAVSATGTAITFNFTTLAGGSDDRMGQPLEFPRRNAYDRYGQLWRDVPLPLRQATAEYALRILNSVNLWPDTPQDASGKIVNRTRSKVGPIETETEFETGGALQIPAYPAADRLMTDLLTAPGGVFR